MESPLISVVIPTRDRVKFLPDVLGSLSAQVCEAAFEVIVVDNASSDGTRTLLIERSDADPRFRWLHEPTLGRSVAMNAGAAAARGTLLLFTDDDVVIPPDWLESYRRFFAPRTPAERLVVGGPIHPIASDLGRWPPWLDAAAVTDLIPLDLGDSERVLGPPEYLWGANMAMHAQVFRTIGGWDPTVGRRGHERGTYEDVEYQDRVRHGGGAVWYSPAPRVFHRVPHDLVTPARILSNAFARGRNSVWLADRSVPAADVRDDPADLVGRFAAWAVDTIGFRARRDARSFERARLAAAVAGSTMERWLRTRGNARRTTRAAASASWWASRAIVHLAGDSGPSP